MKLLTMTLAIFLLAGCASEAGPEIAAAEVEKSTEPSKSDDAPRPARLKEEPAPSAEGRVIKEERTVLDAERIRISAIGIDANIIDVGVLPNGQMDVPVNTDEVGWLTSGARPGERGNAIMAGHVDSGTGPAVFYQLPDLVPDDEIVIEGKDGKQLTYRVTSVEQYKTSGSPVDRIFDYAFSSQLILITCTGDFVEETGNYEDRLVVTAELMK
ncbi:class F sortase [Indiicoccus explosivorum]|uniref:class F sortase n=1 Tax=Indiicoccus explosivorum TaxID=1917864 RepID=UPI000B4332CD|nr:class F sortase [Indiicoccus explosivorum]